MAGRSWPVNTPVSVLMPMMAWPILVILSVTSPAPVTSRFSPCWKLAAALTAITPMTPRAESRAFISMSIDKALSPAIVRVPFCCSLAFCYLRLDLGILACLYLPALDEHQRLYLPLLHRRCAVAPVATEKWIQFRS